jgi:hypothetical protein
MDNIDEKIRMTRLELTNVRRARWEEEKNFYSRIEELKCGISILRSRMKDMVDSGVDFNFIQAIKQEVDRKNNVPYVALHFGHEVLLVSALHQMEVLKRLLILTAKQGKAMAAFLDESKFKLDEEHCSLALLLDKSFAEADLFVVDDRLALMVVAQRLVIRKIRTILGEDYESNDSGNPIPLGTVIQVPSQVRIFGEKCYAWSMDESCLTLDCFGEESPRHVRNVAPLSKIEGDIGKMEMELMANVNIQSRRRWGLPVPLS